MFSRVVILVALGSTVLAQNPAWGQCGGQSWTGSKSCVSGYTCVAQNPYYSQCIPGGGAVTTTTKGVTKTTTKAATPTSTSSSGGGNSGGTMKASFTQYGAGDTFGSGNCQVKTTACGYYTTGYNAAISENYFGVGPNQGAGPACGTCYKLTIETDSNGKQVSNHGNSIVVEVTNLCPKQGNPICSQNGKGGTNQYGANVNFDLCIDSKANTALFGNSGVGLGVGTAQQVPCTGQVGSVVG